MLRKIVSALVGAMTGALLGGIVLGGLTIFVYFLGFYLGLPLGICVGGWLGWKTPLRNSVLLFLACYGGLIAGIPLGKWLTQRQQGDPMMQGTLEILVPAGMTLIVGALCWVIGPYIPFAYRRRLAFIASGFALAWLIWQVYYGLYISEPGG